MPRSKETELIEELGKVLRADGRFIDVGAQLRVWRCTCGKEHASYLKGECHDGEAQPAELIDDVYGGRYDRVLRQYVGPPQKVVELPCHPGQVELLTMSTEGLLRILALGSPGAGKTMAAVTRALLMALERPNSNGALIAPTNDRRQILWRGLLELAEPLGWVQSVSTTRKEIVLVNGTIVAVLAAKASSRQYGSPLQGRSFDWAVIDESQNVDDEAHVEIATRGRRAGTRYVIIETATNAQVPQFRVRLERFKVNPLYRLLRFTGFDNPWVEPEYWLNMKGDMSEREFREKILAEDVPPERLTYPRFSFAENVVPRPQNSWTDVTAELTEQKFGHAANWIVGQDFGVLVNASIFLKAFRARDGRLRWWACDEITSGYSTDEHAARILRFYDPDDLVVVADPHFNSKESDKSDYNLFKQAGLRIFPATYGQIQRKHRISMFNAMLQDAEGVRRFFIDCDDQRRAKCPRLVQALLISQLNEHGEPEKERKTGINDPSHWLTAAQFGTYPWERIKSVHLVPVGSPKPKSEQPWYSPEEA